MLKFIDEKVRTSSKREINLDNVSKESGRSIITDSTTSGLTMSVDITSSATTSIGSSRT